MGKLKEFYFDEIMRKDEDFIDEEYFLAKWQETVKKIQQDWEVKQENDLADEDFIIEVFSDIQKDCDDATLPTWMHPLKNSQS